VSTVEIRWRIILKRGQKAACKSAFQLQPTRLEPCNLLAVKTLTDFFGEQSPLKNLLPGFQPRAGQGWMAEAVAEAIANSDKLVVEAGTGTGKTFAYLIPALLSGRAGPALSP